MTLIVALATLSAGILIGYLWQRSRSCSISGYRDLILFKDMEFMRVILGMLLGSITGYLIFYQFSPLMSDFPVYLHNEPGADSLFTLTLAAIGGLGYAFFSVMAEGCPLRQHVNATTGNGMSIFYLLGFYSGILFYWLVINDVIGLILRMF